MNIFNFRHISKRRKKIVDQMGVNVESHKLGWILVFCLIPSSLARPVQSIQTETTTVNALAAMLATQSNINIRPGFLPNLRHYDSLTKSPNQIQLPDIPQSTLRPKTFTTSMAVSNRALNVLLICGVIFLLHITDVTNIII